MSKKRNLPKLHDLTDALDLAFTGFSFIEAQKGMNSGIGTSKFIKIAVKKATSELLEQVHINESDLNSFPNCLIGIASHPKRSIAAKNSENELIERTMLWLATQNQIRVQRIFRMPVTPLLKSVRKMNFFVSAYILLWRKHRTVFIETRQTQNAKIIGNGFSLISTKDQNRAFDHALLESLRRERVFRELNQFVPSLLPKTKINQTAKRSMKLPIRAKIHTTHTLGKQFISVSKWQLNQISVDFLHSSLYPPTRKGSLRLKSIVNK